MDPSDAPIPSPAPAPAPRPCGTSLKSIFERDQGICWICQQQVWKDSTHHQYRPSRDHVVPRKDGGRTTPENLRLAHQGCNSARHDAPSKKRPWYERKEAQVAVPKPFVSTSKPSDARIYVRDGADALVLQPPRGPLFCRYGHRRSTCICEDEIQFGLAAA